MREKHTTIRVHMNPDDAVKTLGHTLDKDFRNREDHVLPDGEFEVFIEKSVYDIYKETFGDVLQAYNDGQKRKDRKIVDENGDAVSGYIKQIIESKRGKRVAKVEKKLEDGQKVVIGEKESTGTRLLYEFIISAGNCTKQMDERGRVVMDDTGHEVQPYRMPAEVSKRALKRFSDVFESKYTHLKLCYSVYHADEYYLNDNENMELGVEHMHIGVVPVATGYKRGLSVQQSMTKALEQMQCRNERDDAGVYHTAYWSLCDRMQKDFEDILRDEYNQWLKELGKEPQELIIEHPARGKNRPNLSPEAFRDLKNLEKRKRQLDDVYTYAEEALQESEELEYELQMMRSNVENAERQKEQMYRDIEKEEEHARESLQIKLEEMQKKHQEDMDDMEDERKQSRAANDVIFNTFLSDMDRLKQTTTQMQERVEEYTNIIDELCEKSSFDVQLSDENLLAWMRAQKTKRNGKTLNYLEAYEHDVKIVMKKKSKEKAETVAEEMKKNGADILKEISLQEETARQRRREAELLSRLDLEVDKEDDEYEK